jgi:hypothetical protein
MIEEIFLYITIEDPTIETYVFCQFFRLKAITYFYYQMMFLNNKSLNYLSINLSFISHRYSITIKLNIL